MPTVCKEDNHLKLEFQQADGRRVVADFGGGDITSDGGSLLVRQVASRSNMLADFADCFTDHRDTERTDHSIEQLVSQRVLGITCGYEDLNDHDHLRDDPLWRLLAGKANPDEQPAAGKSTLNRLEVGVGKEADQTPSRYHKIGLNEQAVEGLFTDWYISAHKDDPPEEIILDIDATDDPLYGTQQERFFHGYYGHYCYLPLYIFAGDHLLWSELRPSGIDAAKGSVEAVSKIVSRLRRAWPTVRIILRGDSGFAREKVMRWCEIHGVDYVIGLAKNDRLKRLLAPWAATAEHLHQVSSQTERVFGEFYYQTLTSWSRSRRVVGKAEVSDKGSNPRFVVTSLHPGHYPADQLYEQLYCARGEAENRIKEQQLYLFADRTSCHRMAANQLRLWFSSVAYWLLCELRRIGLQATQWRRAQCHTIRNKLLKIGGLVRVSVRRVRVALAGGYPWKATFDQVAGNIRRTWEPS